MVAAQEWCPYGVGSGDVVGARAALTGTRAFCPLLFLTLWRTASRGCRLGRSAVAGRSKAADWRRDRMGA